MRESWGKGERERFKDYIAGFDREGRGRKLRHSGSLQKLEKARKEILPYGL